MVKFYKIQEIVFMPGEEVSKIIETFCQIAIDSPEDVELRTNLNGCKLSITKDQIHMWGIDKLNAELNQDYKNYIEKG
jgi:hypothetical protein